jgi:hypothetical protein
MASFEDSIEQSLMIPADILMRWCRELEEAQNRGEDVHTAYDAATYLMNAGYLDSDEIILIVAQLLLRFAMARGATNGG